jgi:hypothetical protein
MLPAPGQEHLPGQWGLPHATVAIPVALAWSALSSYCRTIRPTRAAPETSVAMGHGMTTRRDIPTAMSSGDRIPG